MSRRGLRSFTLVIALLAAAATGGCSWLLGVSEDPVLADLAIDSSAEAGPDVREARDGARPDVEEASVDDAPVD